MRFGFVRNELFLVIEGKAGGSGETWLGACRTQKISMTFNSANVLSIQRDWLRSSLMCVSEGLTGFDCYNDDFKDARMLPVQLNIGSIL
jgi:hypothetical protein